MNNEIRIDNDHIKIPKIKNPWIIITIILAVLCLFLFYKYNNQKNSISGDLAGEQMVKFLNSRTGGGVEYISYLDLGDIYEITINYKGENIPVFITEDGEYFIQNAIPVDQIPPIQNQNPPIQANQPTNVANTS